MHSLHQSSQLLKEATNKNFPTNFFCLIIRQHSLQISGKNVENSLEMNSKCVLHSLKFSFQDMQQNTRKGILSV